jgi:hypothetical protein
MAQLAPNAMRAEPVMADSVAPPNRPNVRAPAATAPAVSEVTMMRPRGPYEGAAADPGERPGVVTDAVEWGERILLLIMVSSP